MSKKSQSQLVTVSDFANEVGVSRQRIAKVLKEYCIEPWFKSETGNVQLFCRADFAEYKRDLQKNKK